VRVTVWAIDVYGLRKAYRRSVLGRLRDADRLHVSPFTWSPSQTARTGGGEDGRQADPRAPGKLTIVGRGRHHGPGTEIGEMDAALHGLYERGVLVVEDERECHPRLVADVEGSWEAAGLLGRPTSETLSAIITAGTLGMDLVTEDPDAHRLAAHWQVPTMTVSDLASSLAA
jgi:hypothetical protein